MDLLDNNNIPKHVAIIMDGNGRWANDRNLPRLAGHKEGVNTVREIVEIASEIEIETLTLFTFSSENWKRPKVEVSSLMKLLVSSIRKELKELVSNNIIFDFFGDLSKMDDSIINELNKAKNSTENNDGMRLNLALSYGSRQEIVNAIKSIVRDHRNNDINDINEDLVAKYLLTSGISDPDLLIRTGGDFRLSNFLLWQIAYTELIINDNYWPEFSKSDFISSIKEFQSRERRYGRVKN
tara:strand:+ start:366 stop:1082 length:717 start_codon:yes stop_codon:yes gene_type:complete